ncbi:OB-fold domain-containing protein [Guptibacillus algicola]|uniref:OB-fold domain-containing protein n=1 Tax=Guptibacillus algicola TaxID=225844 RepID=UPI001CD3C945|nr:OB-fold domain-containing protein [Alkalihalobacillus algicola]MCA0988559.1 OB-fold domain-containing protein [Alkalihalobacillus algicola]
MQGIIAYEVYLPHHRISKKEVAGFHGGYAGKGTKSVAHYDEDSLTMAVNASNSLGDALEKYQPGAVYFASTTSPYQEKLGSVTLAKALHLPANTGTIDYGNSLRAASNAIRAGMNAVESGKGSVLVSLSDRRLARPKSPLEAEMGAGAVSFLLGEGDDVLAELIGSSNVAGEQVSQWRTAQDQFLRQWEDRFIAHSVSEAVLQCVHDLLTKTNRSLENIDTVILAGPTEKLSLTLARLIGANEEQVTSMRDGSIGHLGTANGPYMFTKALSESIPGQTILWLQAGDGCEAMLFQTTEAISSYKQKKPLSHFEENSNENVTYSDYLRWYELLEVDEGRRPGASTPSAPALKRNSDQILGLFGSECMSCGQSYYPKQRVCVKCHVKDEMKPFSLQGKKAKVATYTVDYLATSVSPPTIFAVVDIEGGSRMLAQATDCTPDEISIGTEVEFSFRKLYEAGGVHNYFWKVVPKRGVQHES